MHADFTGQVTNNEWRWVVRVSGIAVVLAALPLTLLIVLTTYQNDRIATGLQLMGALHDHRNAALHLAHMMQGRNGVLLVNYLHTPEPHTGVFLDVIYMLLGVISGALSLQPLVVFHVARAGAVFFMGMALYGLGAIIWTRLRTRRLFFVLAMFGGGLGWLFMPFLQAPDVVGSPIYPFQAGLFNVHYPLTIGFLAFLVGGLIRASNVVNSRAPSVSNEGLTVFVFSLVLSVIHPQSLLPILLAFLTLLIARGVVMRRWIIHDLRWMLWVAVPALPMMLYYGLVLAHNPVASAVWSQQNFVPAPDPLALAIGLGIPLIVAVPGLVRAVRRFESDGNQVMLGWLVSILLLMYLSPLIRGYFALGLMIPVAYFATRALEDYWFDLAARRWRYRLLAAFLPLVVASHVVVMFAPLTNAQLLAPGGVTLERGYLRAFRWLEANTPQGVVVLTAPQTGLWLPAWTGSRVVYGSPENTLNPSQKERSVRAWYSASGDEPFNCQALLSGAVSDSGRYRVSYVIFGPRERQIGEGACIQRLSLRRVARFDDVHIYATNLR